MQEYADAYPDRIFRICVTVAPRASGGTRRSDEPVHGEIYMVFDADYIPGPRLLKQLAAPFFDAEVGAVMGRVVPLNVGASLLTRLLDSSAPAAIRWTSRRA